MIENFSQKRRCKVTKFIGGLKTDKKKGDNQSKNKE